MNFNKTALRHSVIQRLKQAAAADPTGRRSAALRSLLAPLLAETSSLKIGIYAPLPHEVDLVPLLHEYPQHLYAFPRCLPEHCLSFHHVCLPEQELRPGVMGILAPLPLLPTFAPSEIDILIVPGLAFTARGARLGYGGGYYDRYIPLCTQARILATAFAEQIVDFLPTEPHDLPIPEILTIHP